MRTYLLVIIVFCCFFVKSQTTYHIYYPNSSANDLVTDLVEDQYSNIIAFGASYNQTETKGRIWKISHEGDTLSKVYSFGDSAVQFKSIFPGMNSEYTVIGTIANPPDFYEDLLILKLDSNLNVIHKKVTELPMMEQVYSWSCLRMNGNYYILTGTAGPSSLTTFVGDPYFIKLNSDFDTIQTYYSRVSGGQGVADFLFSSDSSQIYLFGGCYMPDPLGGCPDEMVIYDTSFNYLGYKVFTNQWLSGHYDAEWINDSIFLMASNHFQGNSDQCFRYIDSSLHVYRERHRGSPERDDYCGAFNTIYVHNQDSIYYFGNDNCIVAFYPQEYSQIRLGILNSDLEPYFERYYGGDAYYKPLILKRTKDGGFIIASNRYDHVTQIPEWDVAFLRVNKEGLIVKSSNELASELIDIYPNPATKILNINLTNAGNINIYNAIGSLVFQESLSKGMNQIEIEKLDKGIYFCKIYQLNKIRVYKLIKSKTIGE